MGIRNLINILQPYGQDIVLDGRSVVIDGPALAHHIWHLQCNMQTGVPSYDSLVSAALAWIRALSLHNVTILAIYFDGHLPPAKRTVRYGRAAQSTELVSDLNKGKPNGCPEALLCGSANDSTCLFPNLPPRTSSKLPPPAFLVPAIFEALKTSRESSSITELVFGEADSFCGRHASRAASLVLTSDSDLLVHDLGDGAVCLLREIHSAPQSVQSSLVAKEYHPRKIAKRLGLPPTDGLRRFAFQVRQRPGGSLSRIVSDCISPLSDPELYQAFLQEYCTDDQQLEDPGHPRSSVRSADLDVRLAELVFQLLSSPSPGTSLRKERRDDDCLVFLPILVDCTLRPSAWESSVHMRQLSYSLVARAVSSQASVVQELRRVQSPLTRGKELQLLTDQQITQAAEQMVAVFERLAAMPETSDLFWHVVAMGQSVMASETVGKKSPVSDLLAKNNAWASGYLSWEFVHFAAEVHACMYSLRMLNQALRLSIGLGYSKSRSFLELQNFLQRLPPLKDFPTYNTILAFIRRMKGSGTLRDLLRCFNISETYLSSQVLRARKAKREKLEHSGTAASEAVKRTLSANKFALLSD